MVDHLKVSLLWGVVGVLSFLVLAQGYELLTGTGIDLAVKAGTAAVVGFLAAAATYLAGRRLPANGRV
ncbi:hypothetical protein BRC83_01970 [Halobacteriales archaeon QS_1_68_17]|nr:MAG: hypothetical protein BRC83_01970 [Halobacteriales archaeon QS_1_68_17]